MKADADHLCERLIGRIQTKAGYAEHAAGFLRLASTNSKNLLKKKIYIKIYVIKKIYHNILMNQAGWGASTLTHCLEIGIGTRFRNGPLVLV